MVAEIATLVQPVLDESPLHGNVFLYSEWKQNNYAHTAFNAWHATSSRLVYTASAGCLGLMYRFLSSTLR